MHAGIFKDRYQCVKCSLNPNLKHAWGCDEKAQTAIPTFEYVEADVHYKFWRCPVKFVPNSIGKFFTILNYHKEFPSAAMPNLQNLSARFYLAHLYYGHYFREYEELKRAQEGK